MTEVIILATLTAAVAQGTPLLLTALGEIMTQRSGVLNLGLEGMMLMGAASSFIVLVNTNSLILAVLAGAICSGLLAFIHGFLAITCRVHQVICGLALNIFAGGLSGYLGKDYNGIAAPKVLPNFRIPLLADIPYVGEIFFHQNCLVYLSYILVIGLTYLIFHTQIGLKLRACGENPAAAYSMGIHVNRIRYLYVIIGGMLAGTGGSFLILSTVPSWVENMTGGRGWIALAIVTCAMWKPGAAMLAAYVFGGVEALAYQLQAISVNVSPVLLKMLPYLATIIVLAAVSIANRDKGAAGPEAMTTPFIAEDN
ncbi:MAG: ABC transporter permease [Lachnospiraceae bacterium]|nr:ABC transporter permease [Lachnospiraceae bacterium]MDO5550995.1 ABC transporter permease [Lachnospiraceae bacterium]